MFIQSCPRNNSIGCENYCLSGLFFHFAFFSCLHSCGQNLSIKKPHFFLAQPMNMQDVCLSNSICPLRKTILRQTVILLRVCPSESGKRMVRRVSNYCLFSLHEALPFLHDKCFFNPLKQSNAFTESLKGEGASRQR